MGAERPFRVVLNGPADRTDVAVRRLRQAAAGRYLVGLMAGALVVGAAVIALTSPEANAATPSIENLCGVVAPGQARCLAERQTAPTTARPAMVMSPNAMSGGYGPADLADAYQLDTSKGYGQTVAIVDAYDDPSAATDLAVYRSQYGLPECSVANGCFQKVNQAGAASPLPGPDRGWAGEISLDLDMVSAVCPQCNILLVEAKTASMADLGTAVDTAVRLGAKFVSNSYGGPEYNGVAGNDVHYNHPGVVITASTGDNGYGTSYPASSPFVTAVGGTTLLRSANTSRGWSEAAWAGAGSGCSAYEGKPSFQTMTNCAGRALSDVSAVANPNTGVNVYGSYSGGGWGIYGGTSASAPIIAATYALAGTPGPNDYPNSYPYANAAELNDVSGGSNGSCSPAMWCSAVAGWDGPTGLGSPDSAAAFSASGAVNGTPAKFGVLGKVAGPVVAGLPISVSVLPMLPDGDALASVNWKAARTDCTFSAPTGTDTTVSCPAGLVGTTTVTATARDSAGVTKSSTMSLSFTAVASKRPVTISLNVAGQSGSAESMCTSAATPLVATVTDTATGLPIKSAAVTFTRQLGTAAATTAGSASSVGDGTASFTTNATAAVSYGAKIAITGPFAAASSPALPVTVAKCTSQLTGQLAQSFSYYGDPVEVSGDVTRSLADGSTVALPGAAVQLIETSNGRSQLIGTAAASVLGAVHIVAHPISSGELSLVLPATNGWTASSIDLGPLTVYVPTTSMTAAADKFDVGYAEPLTVSGTLNRVAGLTTSPLARSSVSIRTVLSGRTTVLGSATVGTDGSFRSTVAPRAAGDLVAVYAGVAGQPAASVDLGPITVGTWTTTLTAAAGASQLTAGAGVKVTGTVARFYNGGNSNAPAVPVGLYLHTTTGADLLLTTATTNASGAFSTTVSPQENGTLIARVHAVAGYTDASTVGIELAVTSKVSGSAPSVTSGGRPVSLSVALVAPRVATVTVQDYVGGTWVDVAGGVTATTGRVTIAVSGLAIGNHSLRVSFAGDDRGAGGVSNTMLVAVRA